MANKEYNSEYYKQNKKILNDKRRINNRNRYKRYLWKVQQIKAKNPCPCGESDPRALEFHHEKGSENKKDTVSNLVRNGASWARIQAEIDKCDIICSNCHRKKHIPLYKKPIPDDPSIHTSKLKGIKERKKAVFVTIRCPVCGNIFEKQKSQTHLNPNRKKRATFCSRRCGGIGSKITTKEFTEKINKSVIKEYNI